MVAWVIVQKYELDYTPIYFSIPSLSNTFSGPTPLPNHPPAFFTPRPLSVIPATTMHPIKHVLALSDEYAPSYISDFSQM